MAREPPSRSQYGRIPIISSAFTQFSIARSENSSAIPMHSFSILSSPPYPPSSLRNSSVSPSSNIMPRFKRYNSSRARIIRQSNHISIQTHPSSHSINSRIRLASFLLNPNAYFPRRIKHIQRSRVLLLSTDLQSISTVPRRYRSSDIRI